MKSLVVCVLVALLTGCAAVKRFLVPPPHAGDPAALTATTTPAGHLADLVLYVGRIHGAPKDHTAIALRGGRVLAIGTPEQMQPLLAPTTQVIRQSSAVLLPGFVDAHVHLDGASLLGDAADLRKATTRSQVEAALTEATGGVVARSDWLWAFGLTPKLAAQVSMADLDRVAGDVALYVSRADGHGGLVNAAMLKRLPQDVRDLAIAAGGRLDEKLARAVWRSLPSPRPERWKPLIAQTLLDLQQHGLTEVHAMGATADLRDVLVDLERDGRLPLRVKLFLDGELPEARALLHPPPPPKLPEGETPPPAPVPAWKQTHLVQVVGVKFWLDGTLGARTAALTQPYADDPGRGELAMTDVALADAVTAADRAGLQVAVHAIGDAAVAQIARVLAGLHRPDDALPVRIEHAQVVAPETLAHLAGLRVLCSVQPLHARDDVGFFPQRLGSARQDWGYRLASLAKVCPLLAGSDLPVSEADPLAMWQAMTQAPGRASTERMDPNVALQALLPGGTASGRAVPEPGERVDLVVWSRDPLLPGPEPEVLAVVVAGQPSVLTLNDRGEP